MENVNFQTGGESEEIERALMDLGPLLGVSIKEEVVDEAPDTAAAPQPQSLPPSGGSEDGGGAGSAGGGAGEGGEGEGKEGADSLASPPPPHAARCIFCSVQLTRAEGTPKFLECLHSACEPCLKLRLEERPPTARDFLGAERPALLCPVCRIQSQPANMIDQYFVIEKINMEQSSAIGAGVQTCNSCEDPEPATSYCVDCAEFICDNCVNAHQRLKITKEHTIKSKEEAAAEAAGAARGAEAVCGVHPGERLALYCETCERLTCRDCQLSEHRDHKYQFAREMAAAARASLAALLAEVSYKRVLLASAMRVIRDRQALIADKKRALVHEITQTVVKLTNAINTRGKQLVLRLGEVCDAKQRTLAEKKAALEALGAATEHAAAVAGGALAGAGDAALLAARPALAAHLARVKARRADIPNPEIPVRIALHLDKLPELLRVLGSLGAVVVDGKPDPSSSPAPAPGPAPAPAALGPYHPPPAPAPPASPQSSAVAALQHHAMHQQFVQAGGVAGVAGVAGGMGGLGALGGWAGARRPPTPLRHPHVSSTTHPHQIHGMNEMNLRGLLGARGLRPHQLHAYHHMMNAAYGGASGAGAAMSGAMGGATSGAAGGASGRRSGGPRTPSPSPAPPPYRDTHAKWHIPQHHNQHLNGGFDMGGGMGGAGAGNDFKITLGRPQGAAPGAGAGPGAVRPAPAPAPAVTSTNPKTPSPNLNGGASLELDKVCAESVQDLMATIAKLDSNGVQVLAERASPAAAPPVHSSTEGPPAPAPAPALAAPAPGPPAAPDPNEDWCAVCMDGGELMCCDRCPKVFHQYCHIPTIDKLPDESETWQCLLCVNFADLPEDDDGGEMEGRTRRIVERLTLELYCQYELSLALRAPAGRPGLDGVRARLQPHHPRRYTAPAQFVRDVRAVFRAAHAAHAGHAGHAAASDAARLEAFFDAQLAKLLPEFAYWSGDGEPPAKRARPAHDAH